MKTHEQYEQELFEKEIDFLPLESYTLAHNKILHECINGHQFYESPSNILRGRRCLVCSGNQSTKSKNTEEHIQDLVLNNSNFVLKSGQTYLNNKSPLVYVCNNGHEKSFRPTDILKGYGCIDCVPRGRYTNTYFNRNPLDAKNSGILYIVQLTNGYSTFIKVGITKGASSSDLKKRVIRYTKFSPVVLLAVKSTLMKAFETEQTILRKYNKYKYVSKDKFSGHTELLSIEALPYVSQEILSQFTEEVKL